MTERQILDWIHSTEKFGSVLGLKSIRELMNRLGNPQEQLQFIHVAGTNGKGSICSMLASVLTESGYKTGLYTSPYIEQFRERIRIDGIMISESELVTCGNEVKKACEEMVRDGLSHPTEFELVTAIGFLYYAKQKCDYVVLEVGLGGRLDATNVISSPLLTIITTIDFDHVARLGNTLKEIAFEKCGIIKKGTSVVTSPNQAKEVLDLIKKRVAEEKAKLIITKNPENETATFEGTCFRYDNHEYTLPLLGDYQTINGATVIECVHCLRELGVVISEESLCSGLKKVTHIARMEFIRKNMLIDGGHNLSGIESLCDFVRRNHKNGRIYVVSAMLEDKDYKSCAKLLRELADVLITTETDSPRKIPAEKFATFCQSDFTEPDCCKAVQLALGQIEENDLILVCGSFTLVGPIRSEFIEK